MIIWEDFAVFMELCEINVCNRTDNTFVSIPTLPITKEVGLPNPGKTFFTDCLRHEKMVYVYEEPKFKMRQEEELYCDR